MTAIQIPQELAEKLTAWADERGADLDDAVTHLLTQALKISHDYAPSLTIWDLYPEAEDTDDLVDLIHGDDILDGAYADYEGTNKVDAFGHGYGRVRGCHWIYHRDADVYEVCTSEEQAESRFRDACIAAVANWTPADGRVWGDCGYDGDYIQRLGEAGLIDPRTYE